MAETDLADEARHQQALEDGRILFARPCTFLLSVASIGQLPPPGLPEVAMIGRSNVGKSSLINALTNRRQLARTSNTPGRTQQINLFELGERLVLADLPGYGFARAPLPAVEKWQKLIRAYLKGRPSLRQVCMLIDARHGPKPVDRAFMTLLAESAVAFRIVLTKTDLVGQAPLQELLDGLEADLKRQIGAHPRPLATSAKAGVGMQELKAALAQLAAPPVDQAS